MCNTYPFQKSYSQCKSFNSHKSRNHLSPFSSPIIYAGVCKEKISLSTNLYLNLFLNISFVLIYLFCYYHATVIENIVNTRLIMY